MQEYSNDTLLDFSKDKEEIKSLYGDVIENKLQIAKNEIYIEELADKVILKIDEEIVSNFDFSEESIDYLEKIIDDGFKNNEEEVDKELLEELAIDMGAYLGATIINNLGGYWRFRDNIINSSVYFPSIDGECFPFHKIIKRLLYGKDENISSFYVSIIEFLGVSDY
jgi:O-phosphoseryl-tRNA(Cys) synthetase